MSVQVLEQKRSPFRLRIPPKIRSRNGYQILPLESGDHLTQAEFHRRYLMHPEIKKAELVEGVVFMPSPARVDVHGYPHFDIIAWCSPYRAMTPHVRGSDNSSLILDDDNEVQPDVHLRLDPSVGGRSYQNDDGYLAGTPELIIEVAASSVSYDLNSKKQAYERHGIQEYVVFQTYEQEVSWFVLRNGVYEELMPDDDGIFRSQIFPGLWLDASAFWAGDMASVMRVVQEGMSTQAYAAFIERLNQ
ncbi:MAG: Uma2 family endonuclease [Chloroflexota bacterium]